MSEHVDNNREFEAGIEQFKQFVEDKLLPTSDDDGTHYRANGAVFGVVPVDEVRFETYDSPPEEDEVPMYYHGFYHDLEFLWRGEPISGISVITNPTTGRAVVTYGIYEAIPDIVEDKIMGLALLTGALESAKALLASPTFQPVNE